MGTGKTSVGLRVAKSLGFSFVDTDECIVRKAGKSIPDIFEERGESGFRDLETEVLRDCLTRSGQVVSTGGGIVVTPENLPLLESGGYTIWLKAGADTIFERVSRNSNRPLLQTTNPRETIATLLADRQKLYESAMDLSIATDDLTMEETCFGVTESTRVALGLG